MSAMAELALYRKYRPATFAAVLGQEHITKVLEAQVKKDAVAHAYLFTGPRGTGKTSVARILAAAAGCRPHDLHEMDAASNRGIDDMRELRDAVFTLPFFSPVKVYIIDEVHMLTRESFNALLKTLEEPPAHVIFILATTELAKVPETIVSRCQTFVFKKPSLELVGERVARIAQDEGYALEPEAASLIAFLADGSFRDAEGILQKVLTVSEGKKVSADSALEITGAPDRKLVRDYTMAILGRDRAAGLSAIDAARAGSVDMRIFARLAMRDLRMAMLVAFAPEMKKAIAEDVGKDEFDHVASLAAHERARNLPDVLRALIEAYAQMRYSAVPELPLELALIESAGKGDA